MLLWLKHKVFKVCCMLYNLPLYGSTGWHFAWCNRQRAVTRVYSKIDWALGNFHWIQDYVHVEAEFMNPSVSDHSFILKKCCQHTLLHPKPFKLYTNIMELPQFSDIVKSTWQHQYYGKPMMQLWNKLKDLKPQLKDINTHMASYSHKLALAREKLDII
ncbi:hypothetical protein K7X08_035176 [Anisodus acutangulus]|uniref:Uncharacterized protein n=1 Tax=Anisodus acutangulus TaxID=402998 RepID=A0A9Q1R0C7_9SOLA|nr:hypothetical protein K7X08_035176 [Anisodus acutangulus]